MPSPQEIAAMFLRSEDRRKLLAGWIEAYGFEKYQEGHADGYETCSENSRED